LLLDEELSSREQFLNNYLLKKQEEKVSTGPWGICTPCLGTDPTRGPHLIRIFNTTLIKYTQETRGLLLRKGK
jgi:hypothetical protein